MVLQEREFERRREGSRTSLLVTTTGDLTTFKDYNNFYQSIILHHPGAIRQFT